MNLTFSTLLCVTLACFAISTWTPAAESAKKPIYLNTKYSFKERAADLISRMTLEEKQSQLGNTMPPIPRLGINKYDVWGEALHGVMGRNNNSGMTATSFPNSVAIGSSWDPELIKRETGVIADEARGFNHDLIFTLTYWSPVIEPARDPRWGRTAETFGEDPFLVSQIGSGFVRGLMGDDHQYIKAVPCGKHYFANNTEFNRHSGSSNMDDRDMREFYLFPYRTLIEIDKLPSIMTAYNAVNGTPMSASKYLVDTIARRTYGLEGYITGDCGAIDDIIRGHHYAKSNAEAAAIGLTSGVDNDCGSVYQTIALDALKKGLITVTDIDKALVNIYTIRMRLGEFDPRQSVAYTKIPSSVINAPAHNDLALEVALKTPVLLKNDPVQKFGKAVLPLDPSLVKKIAILGPQADKVELGDYSGEVEPSLRVSPLAGMKNYIAQHNLATTLVSKAGGNTTKRTDFFTILSFSTVSNGTVREYDATKFDASANGLITSARFGAASVRGIKDGDWTAYNNVDITNVDSMFVTMTVSSGGGVLEVRVGSKTGNILASEKIAGIEPSGGFAGFGGSRKTVRMKLNTLGIAGAQSLVLVYREAEIPSTDKETLDLAASADVAVVFVGTDQTTGREESDRFAITLPGNQQELIKAIAAVNPNTIVVIQAMGMVEVEQFKQNQNIPGMIFTGYNGQAQGTAIAKILFGEANPGGKTSLTWYKSIDDLPEFNDYSLRGGAGKNGRTYMYFKKDVSYEFGYGLSYTRFEYSRFAITKNTLTPNDKVTVSVDVKNSGQMDGDEVVQLYVSTPDSPVSLERPIKRLKGFKRVSIPRVQTRSVSIDIDCADLWFWNPKKKRITFDQGTYVFEIGASSKDIKGKLSATMRGTYTPVLKTVVADVEKIVVVPGESVQTSVSASLSDDSFITLDEARVTYGSSNPSVATVDANGKVKAAGIGSAQITAAVTYNGDTVSNSYPLKVMPDLTPKAIAVDGKAIDGFAKDVKAYSYLLTPGARIPVVSASAVASGVTTEITQPATIPGTAVVVYIDTITYEKNIYYINFDGRSVSDEFNGPALDARWHWLRENTSTHSLSKIPGALAVTSEAGDVSESSNNAKNILLQSANNDWTIETKLVCSRTPSQPENAGVLAYENDDNFVKLMFRAPTKTTRMGFGPGATQQVQAGTIDLIVEENGIARPMASFNLSKEVTGQNNLYLRLVKLGNVYAASYSVDGTTFAKLGSAAALLKDIQAGLIACDGVIIQSMKSTFYFNPDTTKLKTPFDVSFEYFHIVNTGR